MTHKIKLKPNDICKSCRARFICIEQEPMRDVCPMSEGHDLVESEADYIRHGTCTVDCEDAIEDADMETDSTNDWDSSVSIVLARSAPGSHIAEVIEIARDLLDTGKGPNTNGLRSIIRLLGGEV